MKSGVRKRAQDTAANIQTIAILRRKASGNFEFVVRWFLGSDPASGNRLPLPTDTFPVSIELMASQQYLQPNGTFAATPASITVGPMNYLMLDPPRSPMAAPGTSYSWMAATTPTGPVQYGYVPTGTPPVWPQGMGFGVCNLLANVSASSAEWRAAKLLRDQFARIFEKLRGSGKDLSAGGADELFAEAIARNFAHFLVRRRVRAVDLHSVFVRAYKALQEQTVAQAGGRTLSTSSDAIDLFRLPGYDSLPVKWLYAGIIAQLLRNESFLKKLTADTSGADDIRGQLRLRSLQGGNLIDFWCSPQASNPCPDDTKRGAQIPASEALGMGLTIGNFTPSDVQNWVNNGESVLVTVSMTAPTIVQSPLSGDSGFLMNPEDDGVLSPGCYPIELGDLQSLLNPGTSSTLPVLPPQEAFLCYDMLQTNAGVTTDANNPATTPQIGFQTGDGRVEFLISAPPQRAPSLGNTCFAATTGDERIGGFNIYGMWEMPSTANYFANPDTDPTLDQLRPWLITRRYSLARDLQGAFPATNPNFQNALAYPPWQPVFQRLMSDQWTDAAKQMTLLGKGVDQATAASASQLPNVLNPNFTVFDFDLRTGMQATPMAEDGWDSQALPCLTWGPNLDRDQTPVATPQRYRFWVTTVDCFEQESQPVSALVHDADAGEAPTKLYRPLRRAAILPPPEREPQPAPTAKAGAKAKAMPTQGRGLWSDSGNLTVYWETPYLNQTGGSTKPATVASNAVRADKSDLQSAVVLYRRRLHKAVNPPTADKRRRLANPSTDPTTLPQWQVEINGLIKQQGWVEFSRNLAIGAPAASDLWTWTLPLQPCVDEGFEYLAIISVYVVPAHQTFWASNVLVNAAVSGSGRTVQLVPRTDPNAPFPPVPTIQKINETPCYSDAVATRPYPVPNNNPPRGITVVNQGINNTQFYAADPVLPPAGIYRDLVLQNLLTNPFDVSQQYPPSATATDTDAVVVTAGQFAMLETALQRTTKYIPRFQALPPQQANAELDPTRWMFASDFKLPTGSSQSLYRQHATIGFRGLQELSFQYRPLAVAPALDPANPKAEAEKFRIYSVRVQNYSSAADPKDDPNVTSVVTNVPFDATSGQCVFPSPNDPKLNPIWDGQPAAIRVISIATATAVYGVPQSASNVGGSITLTMRFPGGSIPASGAVTLAFYMAQPLYTFEPTIDYSQINNFTLYLPVGGGGPETFFWWVSAISAQENETGPGSDPEERPVLMLDCPDQTTEPDPPGYFGVLPPTNPDTDWLDPTGNHQWLPSAAFDPVVASSAPRLLLTWVPPATDAKVYVIVERQERLVSAAGKATVRPLDSVRSAWDALLMIEGAGLGSALMQSDVTLINGWLLGDPVSPPQDSAPQSDILIGPSLNPPLYLPAAGVKQPPLTFPGIGERSVFIDYYRNLGDLTNVMDANWEYNYRLTSYVLIGNSVPLPSRPTVWSGFQLPETTEINMTWSGPTATQTAPGPEVAFTISLKNSSAAPAGATGQPWMYRIVVRRKRTFSIQTSPAVPAATSWQEVGSPVYLGAGVNSLTVIDCDIERDSPADPLNVAYQITATEVAGNTSDSSERLIRSSASEGISFSIPGLAPGVTTDQLVTVQVIIS